MKAAKVVGGIPAGQASSQIVTRSRSPSAIMGTPMSCPEKTVPSSPKILPPLPRSSIQSPGHDNQRQNGSQQGMQLAGGSMEQSLASLAYFEQYLTQEQLSEIEGTSFDLEAFQVKSEDDKLLAIMMAINDLNKTYMKRLKVMELAMFQGDDAIFPRIREMEREVDSKKDDMEKCDQLEERNSELTEEVRMLRGIVQVQDRKIHALNDQILDLKSRSMAKNIVISGITGDDEYENCKEKATDFAVSKLQMVNIKDGDIKKAHRLGKKTRGAKPRPMVVKCSDKLRYGVFQHTKNLKGLKNSLKDPYYVDPQMPEEIAAKRKEISYHIAKIRKANEGKNEEDKTKYEVKDKVLYVDGASRRSDIPVPSVTELLNMNKKEVNRILDIDLVETDITEERGSAFFGYAIKASSKQLVGDVYKKVKIWHPEADHVTMAARINGITQSCDDGEHKLGLKLQKLLDERNEEDVAVFIVREYGGTRLGPKRFHISINTAKQALNKL